MPDTWFAAFVHRSGEVWIIGQDQHIILGRGFVFVLQFFLFHLLHYD
jgi:hypothetical protein